MATYPKLVWDQLKNKTKDEIIAAIEKDGWALSDTEGKQRVYVKDFPGQNPPYRRVTIHYHPKAGFGPSLLKHILEEEIGWSIDDMRRLKLIK